jgi:hypothetical protein
MRSPFSAYQEENAPTAASVADILRRLAPPARIQACRPPISHRDVSTIMGLIGDIRFDVAVIRRLLEDEDGEEEADEADA